MNFSQNSLFCQNLKHSDRVNNLLEGKLPFDIIKRIIEFSKLDETLLCYARPFRKYLSKLRHVTEDEIVIDDFLNVFCFGIPTQVLLEYSEILGFGISFSQENKFKANTHALRFIEGMNGKASDFISISDNYFIKGSSLVCCEVIWIQEKRQYEYKNIKHNCGDLVHYVQSSDKSVEALNASIEQVIKTKLNSTFNIVKSGIYMEKNTNREWALAQTVYILSKRLNNQKFKNLHLSKNKGVLSEAENLVNDVQKMYNFFMRDNDYYISASNHYTLDISSVSIPVERTISKWQQQPDLYVPESSIETETKKEEETNVMLDLHDRVLDEALVQTFLNEHPRLHVQQFKDLIIKLAKAKKDEFGQPNGMLSFDLMNLSQAYGMNPKSFYYDAHQTGVLWELYEKMKPDLLRFMKEKDKQFSHDMLEKYAKLKYSEFEGYLKQDFPGLSKNQLKKLISTLKKELQELAAKKEEMEKQSDEKEQKIRYVAVPQPPILVKETVVTYKRKTVSKLIPKKLIQSEEAHKDFIKHTLNPDPKILYRNAKHRYSTLVYSTKLYDMDYEKEEHLANCFRGARAAAKKLRNCFTRGLHAIGSIEYKKLVHRKAIADKKFYDEYNIFKKHLDGFNKDRYNKNVNIKVTESELDFNEYDFEHLNLIKLKILLGEVYWSRDKLKLRCNKKNRALIFQEALKV